jgi:hypothetical protein
VAGFCLMLGIRMRFTELRRTGLPNNDENDQAEQLPLLSWGNLMIC